MRTLARRIAAVEARKASKASLPRFVIPPKPRTDAERADWKRRFKAHQFGLVGFHRRERIAATPLAAIRPTLPVGMVAHPMPHFGTPNHWRQQ